MPQLTNTNRPRTETNRFPWLGLIPRRPIRVVPKQQHADPENQQLHLVTSDNTLVATVPNIGQPIDGPTDPRWVLAVRTAESIDSGVLSPDKREKLARIGRIMGLRPFDTSMVIAIVQDQARRGYAPEFCPTAGEAQLRMIPLPQSGPSKLQRAMAVAATIVAVITAELAAVAWLLR